MDAFCTIFKLLFCLHTAWGYYSGGNSWNGLSASSLPSADSVVTANNQFPGQFFQQATNGHHHANNHFGSNLQQSPVTQFQTQGHHSVGQFSSPPVSFAAPATHSSGFSHSGSSLGHLGSPSTHNNGLPQPTQNSAFSQSSHGLSLGEIQSAPSLLTPQIMKHVYVHVIPNDPPPKPIRPVLDMKRPVKHYKMVFIKTPSKPQPQFDDIAIPEPPEEKTLIYVLSENAAPIKPLALRDPVRRPESPPEVFIVKYDRNQGSSDPGTSQQITRPPVSGFGANIGSSASFNPQNNLLAGIQGPFGPQGPTHTAGSPLGNAVGAAGVSHGASWGTNSDQSIGSSSY